MKTSELLNTAADRIATLAETDEDHALVEELRIRSAEILDEPPSAALDLLERA